MGTSLKRILVIEDEEDIRMLVRMSLEISGMAVHECGTGHEALACVDAVNPQLVLCDMMLPGMEGTEVLSRLRARPNTAEIPVVFLTAKVNPSEVAGYRQLGAAGVLHKPFDPVALGNDLIGIWNGLDR